MYKQMKSLINKYNIPGPRYTSYPTVPYWNTEQFTLDEYKNRLKKQFNLTNSTEGISIYIHLPFCESLCTFCGCHKRITKRHDVESPYIKTLLKEWDLYCDLFKDKPIIKELHLGGGTPTFFSCDHLEQLIQGILSKANLSETIELSFEGHPNNTTYEHLETLKKLGFSRVSFGVQDYDATVQKAIHRIQTYEQVSKVTQWARELGYTSISHDIIYGLPFQTIESIRKTIELTHILSPDRISFYSYAHVPWIKGNGQRGFKDEDIPQSEAKRELYELGKEMLQQMEYVEIGMDHFSKKTDSLHTAFTSNTMHRNFMGYSSSKTTIMIGLGASSIGDTNNAFVQNEKSIEEYSTMVQNGKLPIVKGHLHSQEDLSLRSTILDIICHFETNLIEVYPYIPKEQLNQRLKEFISDKLIEITDDQLRVTQEGKAFVRNICMAFDEHLIHNQPSTQLFSMTI